MLQKEVNTFVCLRYQALSPNKTSLFCIPPFTSLHFTFIGGSSKVAKVVIIWMLCRFHEAFDQFYQGNVPYTSFQGSFEMSRGTSKSSHKHQGLPTLPYPLHIVHRQDRLHYVWRWQGNNLYFLIGKPVDILIYVDNKILVHEFHAFIRSSQFSRWLMVNIGKTKAMIINNSALTCWQVIFTL